MEGSEIRRGSKREVRVQKTMGQLDNSVPARNGRLGMAVLVMLLLAASPVAFGDKKKKDEQPPQKRVSVLDMIDKSKIVWPQPPMIARVRYLDYFAGEKLPDFSAQTTKPKSSWMDRLAGTSTDKADNPLRGHFFMGEPHGLAVDSKGRLYVADGKVGAIFIIDPETKDTEMIKNGKDASFALINGLAIDDSDRLFVSDSQAHRVLVFDKNHKGEAAITQGLVTPAGMAIDNENRFLYVADIGLDQVLVYDADNLTPIRSIGTPNTKHQSSALGDFSKPTSVALGSGRKRIRDRHAQLPGRGLRRRWQVHTSVRKAWRWSWLFRDAEGNCGGLRWTHLGDGLDAEPRSPVYAGGRPADVDGQQAGRLPGTFSGLQYILIDKTNRVFTSEVYPGRVQMFRYVTQEEAQKEKERRDAEKAARARLQAPTTKPQKEIPPPFPTQKSRTRRAMLPSRMERRNSSEFPRGEFPRDVLALGPPLVRSFKFKDLGVCSAKSLSNKVVDCKVFSLQ